MSEPLFGRFTGLSREPAHPVADLPLIVAIHGGSYTSAYFDIPGYSLLDRAAAAGVRIIAPDRNGYGGTPMLEPSGTTIADQARSLVDGLGDAWHRYGEGCSGIVLIGHSIGGAIAARIASDHGALPVIGLAISGVGLRTPAEHRPMWEALPDVSHADLPPPLKDQVMFGPEGSFALPMPGASHAADAPALRAELVDIVSRWQDDVESVLAQIRVPVHYRQGEFDRLWIVDADEVAQFAAALTSAPRADAAMLQGTGHCLDFHRIGPAFQAQQIGFALQCAAEPRLPSARR